MKRLAIIGLGLMGGSLGLAVKRRGLAVSVHGYARREETRRSALACGAVDHVFGRPEEAVRDADLVVFCLPVLAVPEVLRQCLGNLSSGAVVTDVGSTKAELVRECERQLQESCACFVGSHPVAGSEETGIGAARGDLYEGAVVVVTPAGVSRDDAVQRVSGLWAGVGAKVVTMAPDDHDRLLARTSHLPHLVAAMLVKLLKDGGAEADVLCGSGFRDTTRVAGGSEDVWHDIVKSNRHFVERELAALEGVLHHVRAMVAANDFDGIRRFLAESREKRQELDQLFKNAGSRR